MGESKKKLHLVTLKTSSIDYRMPAMLDADDRDRLGRALLTIQNLGHISSWSIEAGATAFDLPSLMQWFEREGFFDTEGKKPGNDDWPYSFERPSI